MASDDKWDEQAERASRPYAYPSALRTSVRNNSSAYGFSLSITVSFGLATSIRSSPHILEAFLFLVGAAAAFAVVEGAASKGFRRRMPREQEEVVMLSGAMDMVAVIVAAGVAAGLAQVPGLAAWPLVGCLATTAYLLTGGMDVLLARRVEQAADNDKT